MDDRMAALAHPGRMLFVSLPVVDLERSTAFYAALGFRSDPTFSGEGGVCLPFGEQAAVMLLTHEKFAELSQLPTADPATHTLALYCFAVASRDEVDAVADAALTAGARDADETEDHGFMYSRAFYDPDGHGWQVMWMDPAAAEQDPEAVPAESRG